MQLSFRRWRRVSYSRRRFQKQRELSQRLSCLRRKTLSARARRFRDRRLRSTVKVSTRALCSHVKHSPANEWRDRRKRARHRRKPHAVKNETGLNDKPSGLSRGGERNNTCTPPPDFGQTLAIGPGEGQQPCSANGRPGDSAIADSRAGIAGDDVHLENGPEFCSRKCQKAKDRQLRRRRCRTDRAVNVSVCRQDGSSPMRMCVLSKPAQSEPFRDVRSRSVATNNARRGVSTFPRTFALRSLAEELRKVR